MSRCSGITFFILALCYTSNLVAGRKAFSSVHIRKVFTDSGRKYVSNYSAIISPDKTTLNLTLNIIKKTNVDRWAKLSISLRESKNLFRVIFSYNLNLCMMMRKPKGMDVSITWIQNIYKYSNLPRECNIAVGNYYWNNLRVDKESIPPFFITGLFKIDILVYLKEWNNDMLTNTSALVDIKMK